MMTEPKIELEEQETKGRLFSRNDDGSVAEVTFSRAGDTMMIIDHTSVPDAFRGTGMGLALVRQAVEYARERGIKILPLCPFAAAQFKRHPEWADVLKQQGQDG